MDSVARRPARKGLRKHGASALPGIADVGLGERVEPRQRRKRSRLRTNRLAASTPASCGGYVASARRVCAPDIPTLALDFGDVTPGQLKTVLDVVTAQLQRIPGGRQALHLLIPLQQAR